MNSTRTTELEVSLRCRCGRGVVARSRDAGGSVNCTCGKSVDVPNLSQLRLLAGTDAYITNPAEAIRKSQREGKEPAGRNCMCCGASYPQLYECTAICEQTLVEKTGGGWLLTSLLAALCAPFAVHVLLLFRDDTPTSECRGHDVEVKFSLPLCRICSRITGNPTRRAVTKRLMRKVPMLEELLKYYPRLSLKTVRLD